MDNTNNVGIQASLLHTLGSLWCEIIITSQYSFPVRKEIIKVLNNLLEECEAKERNTFAKNTMHLM